MMVNFIYQLDWAMGSPDETLFLGVSVRMFLEETGI